MHILEVIPIARSVGKEALSYFSTTPAVPGSLVTIPLRNREVEALVIAVKDVREMRAELRGADYTMRKARNIRPASFLPTGFVAALGEAGHYYAATTGALLHTFLPSAVLTEGKSPKQPTDRPNNSPVSSLTTKSTATTEATPAFEAQMLLAENTERLSQYRQLIRETMARGASTILIAPTALHVESLAQSLSRGIADYTLTFHGSLARRTMVERWQTIDKSDHPLLVIGTGSALSSPRNDIGLIVVDEENSPAYKLPYRPFADVRTVAEIYARKIQSSFVLAGIPLRPETIARRERGTITDLARTRQRIPPRSPSLDIKLVDMRTYKSANDKTKLLFGNELQQTLKLATEEHERVFLFVARRGFAPTTVCGDCDTVVLCERCSAPVVLHKMPARQGEMEAGPRFVCHKCGKARTPEDRCAVCGGWKLVTLGIGIELVEETLRSILPDTPLFRIDSDATPTRKRAEGVMRGFRESEGGILLGTEMALTFLDIGELPSGRSEAGRNTPALGGIAHAGVISFDSILAMPDFRINERIMDIVLTLRRLAERSLVIQTRSARVETIEQALTGDLASFYHYELAERKAFGYPPYATLIKITLEGKEPAVRTEMERLATFLEGYEVRRFPAFTPVVAGQFVMHALLRLPPDTWPDEKLAEKLRALPLHFEVNVDPQSVL
jgi:primosomal protein N' (replication factor Y)